MRILIVEDDIDIANLYKSYLSDIGECDIVTDGLSAVELFIKRFNENMPYELICMDILMPLMNGREALKRIRAFENKNGVVGLDGVKVVMASALADSKNIIGSFFEQCEAYLVKPIKQRNFRKALKEIGII